MVLSFYNTILESLTRQEEWIATLTPAQQAETRVRMALIELAVKNRPDFG
jgi:hypothetical protein